jgi:transposase IS116/IS110/IS902 family protein
MHLMRQRAALLAPSQNTHSPYNLPESGQKSASKANRAGGAERCPDPAVPQSIAVARALINPYDRLLRDVALAILHTAQPHAAHPLSLRRTVPGIGEMLRLVLLYASHAIQRFPRVQDGVAYCRRVKCATEAAGKRSGTSGTQIGHAYRKWAFSEAAVLCLRHNPQGQTYLTRVENKQGKGTALPVLAHPLARAVSSMLQRKTACDLQHLLQSEPGAERMRPPPNWPIREESAARARFWLVHGVANAYEPRGRCP